jgi:hypothetical protein
MIVGSDLRKIDFFGFFRGRDPIRPPDFTPLSAAESCEGARRGIKMADLFSFATTSVRSGRKRPWLRSDPFRRSQLASWVGRRFITMLHQLMVPQSLGLVRL